MIYFDNSATSFPKLKGMTAVMEDCMLHYCGNPGRSGHLFSMKTGEKVYEARKTVGRLFGMKDAGRLVFTKNTTEGLNMALFGFLREGDHVVTTSMEHNSVLRPLRELENMGVSHTIVQGDEEGYVSACKIEEAIQENTGLIAVTAASNVTGTIMPIAEIGRMAKKKGIPLLVDGAQLAGCGEINVEKMGISMLAFPGHKGLLGPLGTGGLFVDETIALRPLLFGGTGTESKSRVQPADFPEGFEAGTVNAPGIIGLGYATDVIGRVGVETIAFYEQQLIKQLEEALRNMKEVEVYGPCAEHKTGICLFNIKGMECEEAAERLNREFGIAVRGGFHCAGLAHKTIGTYDTGALRLSVGPFNTRREIRKAAEAIWHIAR